MKHIFTSILALAVTTSMFAASKRLTIYDTRMQQITGFGGACCDGAMCPLADDTKPVELLYGDESPIGLNILRMEISPNQTGNVIIPEWGNYDTPYDWNGSLPSAKIVKERGGIVFGTPWSPPGEYKTNGVANGGNAEDQGYQKGRLRKDCYDKFFPWLNKFLRWMRRNHVNVDAVSIQNEPDWWVSYSGCLYEPEEQLELVKNYAHQLDRENNPGMRLISAEPLGFRPDYSNMLLNDPVAREQIDIIAGHIYGHAPLKDGNLKDAAKLALKYGKEVWMTEHSATDHISTLPNWHEQLIFAEELNECLLAGCTGYIYWYLRAHWAFVGTGDKITLEENGVKYEYPCPPGNEKNVLLPRAYVMSHFSKYLTGATRLKMSNEKEDGEGADYEYSSYIKGDSLIVMAIDTIGTGYDLKIKLPYKVKSGVHVLSTGNETENLCQKSVIDIDEPTRDVTVPMPARSLNTYIFIIDNDPTGISEQVRTGLDGPSTYYDLHGRRLDVPKGLCIERRPDGTSRKVMM